MILVYLIVGLVAIAVGGFVLGVIGGAAALVWELRQAIPWLILLLVVVAGLGYVIVNGFH